MTEIKKNILKSRFHYELSRNLWTMVLLVIAGSPMFLALYYFWDTPRPETGAVVERVAKTLGGLVVAGIFVSVVSLTSLMLRLKLADRSNNARWLAPLEYAWVSSKRTLFSHSGILMLDDSNRLKVLNGSKEIFSLGPHEPLRLVDTGASATESHLFGLRKFVKRTYQVISPDGADLLIEAFSLDEAVQELKKVRPNLIVQEKGYLG